MKTLLSFGARTVAVAALAGAASAAITWAATMAPVPQSSDAPQVSTIINQHVVPAVNTLFNPLAVSASAVATLGTTCTAAQKGQVYQVSDATAPAYNATIAGGGAVTTLVVCNGVNWTAH